MPVRACVPLILALEGRTPNFYERGRHINVLVSLHRGYGLGDAVQVSAVLRHLQKHRAHWLIDFQAERGREKVGAGLTANQFVFGEPYPSAHYDAEVLICLYDTWANWGDRPNTRVSSCLHECFGLPWDAECGRYHVAISPGASRAASVLSMSEDKQAKRTSRPRMVAIHYQGDSSPAKKNLTHAQAVAICGHVERLGCTPLLLDWRDTSPIPDQHHIRTTGRMHHSREWGGDAEMNCAVIGQCAAFVGIDSGPSKCASATDTPALVIWTGHHPAPFHDPAENTTHLVPRGYHGLKPVCNDRGAIDWFENHYNVRTYDHDPVGEIATWLSGVLER